MVRIRRRALQTALLTGFVFAGYHAFVAGLSLFEDPQPVPLAEAPGPGRLEEQGGGRAPAVPSEAERPDPQVAGSMAEFLDQGGMKAIKSLGTRPAHLDALEREQGMAPAGDLVTASFGDGGMGPALLRLTRARPHTAAREEAMAELKQNPEVSLLEIGGVLLRLPSGAQDEKAALLSVAEELGHTGDGPRGTLREVVLQEVMRGGDVQSVLDGLSKHAKNDADRAWVERLTHETRALKDTMPDAQVAAGESAMPALGRTPGSVPPPPGPPEVELEAETPARPES